MKRSALRSTKPSTKPSPVNPERVAMVQEYETHLRSITNKQGRPYQEKTITAYVKAVRALDGWMARARVGYDFLALEVDCLNQFFREYYDTHTPGGTNTTQRNLRVFFLWLEEEYDHPNPYRGKDFQRYSSPTSIKPKTLSQEFVKDMLKATGGGSPRVREFEMVRDHAIIRVLTEGLRAEEVLSLKLEDIDHSAGVVKVVPLKSARAAGVGRLVPLQPKTVVAINRYLRARSTHKLADREWLWLGTRNRSRLTYSGLYRMLSRRCGEAGYESVSPHQFRHTWAHELLEAGVSGEDVMTAAGWSDPSMLRRYAADMATSRALKAVSKLGDRY